jgi:hypothetical protein
VNGLASHRSSSTNPLFRESFIYVVFKVSGVLHLVEGKPSVVIGWDFPAVLE